MRNNFWHTINLFFCSSISYCSYIKVAALNLFALLFVSDFVNWFIASFLYCSLYKFRDSDIKYSLLEEKAKSKVKVIALAVKREKPDNYRYRDSW